MLTLALSHWIAEDLAPEMVQPHSHSNSDSFSSCPAEETLSRVNLVAVRPAKLQNCPEPWAILMLLSFLTCLHSSPDFTGCSDVTGIVLSAFFPSGQMTCKS